MKLVNISENITLLEEIDKFSQEISNYYPDYNEWFQERMIPGIIDHTREIICITDEEIIGFISLKKEEKKICTIFVDKKYRRQGFGTILVDKGIEYLEEEKPLITIPISLQEEYSEIIRNHNWSITGTDGEELIVNGRNKVYSKKDMI